MEKPKAQCDVFEALASRRSIRAFCFEKKVERKAVEEILALASRAPSGSNIQPWKVKAVSGQALARLCARMSSAYESDSPDYAEEYPYYPKEWVEPYRSRRITLGKSLYSLLDIAKGDSAAMKAQQGRNYRFFDAPVGLIVTIDKKMEMGSWLDLGAFLMGILLAARGLGLHTCPQQSVARYHKLIREELGIPDSEYVVCGVALGYAEENAVVNRLSTQREPVENFSVFFWD